MAALKKKFSIDPSSRIQLDRRNLTLMFRWEIQAELTLADGQVISAHLTRDRFDELHLEAQQTVYVKPKEAKSFPL